MIGSPRTPGRRSPDASPLRWVSQDRSVHGLLAFSAPRHQVIQVDYALPILHGKNGEDGTVQGLLELAGYSGGWAAAPWPPPCVWTRTGPTSWPPWPGWQCPPPWFSILGEDPQARRRLCPATGLSPLCEARESGLFLRHLPDSPRGRASSRPGPGVSVRQSCDFRGRPSPALRWAVPSSAPGNCWWEKLMRSSSPAGFSTLRRNTP